MARGRKDVFVTVRSEGALLPPDFLRLIAEGRDRIKGLTPEEYHLPGTERLNEATSRSWNRLLGAWGAFQAASQDLKETDPGTSVTREKWLLPLFQELGYGRLLAAKAVEVQERTYPISHGWQHTPIHLVGRNVDLDQRTPGVAGAARISPHSLVQALLNRSSAHLWGFLSNGLRLRILRDSKSLTRQAFVEFDLAEMMEGQVYADFALLWLLCHQSRVEVETPEGCWLEKWAERARQEGTRALEHLRQGVEQAIEALGRGFLAHAANRALAEKLRSGVLDKQDYYRQLLRIVYRLIFLFVAEDRELLLTAKPGSAEHNRYRRYYSVDRLRTLAERRRGSPHGDLWRGFRLVVEKLSSETGCPGLGLPPLGSFLWSGSAAPDLDSCELANVHLLEAVRALAFIVDGGIRRAVDFKSLGPEELGSVYESLLELHPKLNGDAASFTLTTAAGHERKTTGSYYTPTSLVECLLDTALDPVLDEAMKKPDPAQAILQLKVCDLACGSGHFLIAAAHRMAKRLAAVRTGDEEPSPQAVRTALRDVIGHCIYGVDVNPMAVELCKVNLWLEALEPGKPLAFLEHRIQCGNSLLGATPALLKKGIPDEAFDPIEGDDKKYCQRFKKENKKERTGQLRLVEHKYEPWDRLGNLATAIVELDAIPDDTLAGQRAKQERWENLVRSSSYESGRLLADTWCAAFVWRKSPDPVVQYPITEDTFRRIDRNPHWMPGWMRDEVRRLAAEYSFFHWHLAFPDVFRATSGEEWNGEQESGWVGGFDVILGNPPWERVKLQEKEFFAERRPDIAGAPNAAARGKMIKSLQQEDPGLFCAFKDALRQADGESALIRQTSRYPLCGRGDVNTYAVFAELNHSLLGSRGRAGFIVPTGIATDDTTKEYFASLMSQRHLRAFYGFENEAKLFGGVDHRVNFCLMVISRPEVQAPSFAAFIREPSLLRNRDRVYELTAADIATLNPNTGTCPVFRTRRDADLTLGMYRRAGVLWREGDPNGNPWGLRFMAMFHMANDSGLFHTRADLEASGHRLIGSIFEGVEGRYLPLYEAKMVYHFNHRFGDFALLEPGEREHILPQVSSEMLALATHQAMPRYWVTEKEIAARLAGIWEHDWLLGWRDVTDARSSVRTVVASLLPRAGVAHKFPLVIAAAQPTFVAALYANLCSIALDYAARQKIGGTSLTYFILKQLPVLSPAIYCGDTPWSPGVPLVNWMLDRILELTFTAWDLQPFARDCGWSGPPFRWDEERRFVLRCELDAGFFHLYLSSEVSGEWCQTEGETGGELARLKASFPTPRHALAYVMDTFPIVRRRDEEGWGEYRTKRLILEIYDAMEQASREKHAALAAGREPTVCYQSRLNPPPGPPRDAQGNFIPMAKWGRANWPTHIHQSQEVTVESTAEVPVTVFASMMYPSTDSDKAICAAALAVVEQCPGLSSMEHLDALLLATHPDWCREFLGDRERAVFEMARKSAPSVLFVGPDQSIRWKECRDYLENLEAITVAHGGKGQLIDVGTALAASKSGFPFRVDAVMSSALMALDRIRKLQGNLLVATEAQQRILDVFARQHQLHDLVA